MVRQDNGKGSMMKKYIVCGVIALVALLGVVYVGKSIFSQNMLSSQDSLMPFVHPDSKVTESEFEEFLNHLPLNQKQLLLLSLCKSESQKQEIEAMQNVSPDEIIKEAKWMSSHWITYPFKTFDYHTMVQWVAKKLSIHEAVVGNATTFQLEHLICEKMFERMWDKLSPEEREKLLSELGSNVSNISGIAAMSGAAALAALATTEALTGFAFYIFTAKTLVVAAATLFGVSAPTTIATVSALCGPVGWGIAAVALAGGSLLIGGADLECSAAFVIQMHYLKITAMKNSEIDPKQYFLQ